MPRIIYFVASSLDGFIASADGGVDWLSEFNTPGEDYGYTEFFASIDSMLMGSSTYEQVLGFGAWPYGSKPCRVFSQRPLNAVAPGVVFTTQTPEQVVSELKAMGQKRVWLVGGATLAAAFQAQHLITDYLVSVMPVLLGSGIPLFSPQGMHERLKLSEHRSYPSGVLGLHYSQVEVD